MTSWHRRSSPIAQRSPTIGRDRLSKSLKGGGDSPPHATNRTPKRRIDRPADATTDRYLCFSFFSDKSRSLLRDFASEIAPTVHLFRATCVESLKIAPRFRRKKDLKIFAGLVVRRGTRQAGRQEMEAHSGSRCCDDPLRFRDCTVQLQGLHSSASALTSFPGMQRPSMHSAEPAHRVVASLEQSPP